MRIGILTYQRSINYGAFLQSYCLAKYVNHIVGSRADVEIIDYTSKLSYQSYNRLLYQGNYKINEWKKRIGFERSSFLLPLSREYLCSDNLPDIEDFIRRQKYDVIIVGSDEVWKIDGMRGFPTAYWLNFDLGKCKKMAYAVSSRTSLNKIDFQKKKYISDSVKKFCYLGARDPMTANLIEQLSGKTMELNCDPAFLLSFHYDKIAYREKLNKKYRLKKGQKLLGIMIPDSKLVRRIRKEMGKQYVIVALYDSHEEADINMSGINPFEWVKILGCLDFLITDRFHGTVFAIKMNIPFLAIETYDIRENSKLFYLLNANALDDHYIVFHAGNVIYDEILDKVFQLAKQRDSDKMRKAVKSEREKSIGFKKELLTVLYEDERKMK